MLNKKCSTCGKIKTLNSFSKNKNEKDGFHYRCKDCAKKYYENNKEYLIAHTKAWRALNKEHLKLYNKKYNLENKEKISKRQKRYREEHKIELSLYSKEYSKRNKNRIRAYVKHRLKTDLNFKLKEYLRGRVRCALRGNPKLETTMKLVGCSITKLKQHLEKQFKLGMSWKNYGLGGWEIDHIIPCIKFDMTKLEEQKACFNYKNLQPLWARENRQKNSRG